MPKAVKGEKRFMAYTEPNELGEIASWHVFDGKKFLLCDGKDGRPVMAGIKGTPSDARALLFKHALPDGEKWPKPDRIVP